NVKSTAVPAALRRAMLKSDSSMVLPSFSFAVRTNELVSGAADPIDTLEMPPSQIRSEEHTSELQSRRELVCRLLLEKKNHLLGDRARPDVLPHRWVVLRQPGGRGSRHLPVLDVRLRANARRLAGSRLPAPVARLHDH